MFFKKEIYAFGVILIALSGCGGGSNTTTSDLTNNTNTKVGYVIDAPVANLNYKCGNKTAKTDTDGKFECTKLPVTFFIGNIEIGSISSINSDTKVFIQDIVKVDRSDFNNTKVLKLAILLQSLDKDKNSSNSISIPDDLNLSSTKSFDDLSLTELNSLLTTRGFIPVSSSDAEQHLREFSDIDTLAPTLKLNGESSISIFKNEVYKELSATAKDDRDNDLTVTITGEVKTDTVGTYVIKYNVSDKAGNKAEELTRTVIVKEPVTIDTVSPTLTLNGESILYLSKNEAYKELGATAKDDRDNNLTVTITGKVKTDTVGTYIVKYNVSDKAGNKAEELTRTVIVKELVPILTNTNDLHVSKSGDIEPIIFNNTGGAITSCTISPALPIGLTLSSDCKITGTTSSYLPSTPYTITATNEAGSTTANINISVAVAYSANDELLADQWYIKNTGTAPDTWGKFTELIKNADLNVTAAWNQGVTGQGIVVTVVDDGADFTHKDLINQEKKGYRINLDTNSLSDFELTDEDNHGTGCAGIIVAQGNNGGVVGIAPKAQLTAHGTREGINHEISYQKMLEDNISRVSNHSYGAPDNGILYPQNTEEYDIIRALVTKSHNGKGHVMVLSSGNGRDSGASDSEKYGDYAGLDMAQQNPYVISVSGFGATDQEISYAEAGPATLVAGATGETFNYYSNHSIKPLTAPMATTGLSHINYAEATKSFRDDGTPEPTGYNMAFDGTSAAAPTVTGTVALILAANPELTWRDVRWILAKTARKIQLDGKVIDQTSGEESNENYWLSNGNETFGQYSHYFGYGAADAGAAVKLAKSSDYTLLPVQKECILNDDNGVVTISAECPNTIEFVRIQFTVSQNTNISEMSLKMRLNNNANKEILLLKPTYCSENDDACVVTEETDVTSGTVGFLGDSIKTNDTFNFTVTDDNGNSEAIELMNITIMGYDK